jgi:hypothetical protein
MKNIVSISIVIFLISIIFTSCKKQDVTTTSTIYDTIIQKDTVRVQDTVPRPITLTGFYTGKIGNNSDYPSYNMAFLFRSNGTVRVYNNIGGTTSPTDTSAILPAEGTYSVSNDTVKTYCKYLYDTLNTFSTMAIVNSDSTYMEGAWGSGMSVGSGFFFVYKKY